VGGRVESVASLVHRRSTVWAAVVSAVFAVAAASGAGGAPATAPQGTLVFASNRTGDFRIYSVRADGSQFGQLTRGPAADTAPLFSPDGRRIVFTRKRDIPALWLMNADGSGQRRLAAAVAPVWSPQWSPDSRRIAYVTAEGRLAIEDVDGGRTRVVPRLVASSGPYWSPDGRLIAVARVVGERGYLAVVRSDGTGLRTLRRNAAPLGWSPRGEIAFSLLDWPATGVTRPDGRGARRLLPFAVGGLAWSPDGRRLASVGGPLPQNGLHVSSANGTGIRALPPQLVNEADVPSWSPDGRWLAVSYAPNGTVLRQLLVVSADGAKKRPLPELGPAGTDYGAPSWRPRGATPARLGGPPVATPTDKVTATSFAPASGTIQEIAADGKVAAIVVSAPPLACGAVQTWEPARRRLVRLHREDCLNEGSQYQPAHGLAVSGRHVAWLETNGGNTVETIIATATPEQPAEVALADEGADEAGTGTTASRPVGRGGLLAFTVSHGCSESGAPADECPPGGNDGDIIDATIRRLGGAKRCSKTAPTCTVVARADGQLLVLAADARRIVARTDDGVRLLSAAGKTLQDLPVEATAAALSGTRLALRRADAIEVYDTGTGQLTRRLPVAKAVTLADLGGDILATSSGTTVALRRLPNGRTVTFRTDGPAKAKLTKAGLFLAGTHRVTFIPLNDVVRRLGG
jgi:WD40-like Beta Propeller Repeat